LRKISASYETTRDYMACDRRLSHLFNIVNCASLRNWDQMDER